MWHPTVYRSRAKALRYGQGYQLPANGFDLVRVTVTWDAPRRRT